MVVLVVDNQDSSIIYGTLELKDDCMSVDEIQNLILNAKDNLDDWTTTTLMEYVVDLLNTNFNVDARFERFYKTVEV